MKTLLCLPLLFATAAGAGSPGGVPALVSRFLEEEVAAHHFECGAVVVVANSGIVFERGYGDCAPGHAAPDPAVTIFRAASNSKLFAAVAALQLAERGALGLDVDVREYLPDVPIENPFRTPLTMAHLLTHTSGIEPRMLGALALTAARRKPLFEFFRDRRVQLTREPGTLISYSNLGIALAGLIVERVATTPYERYVEEHIFVPLGMASSSFRQPLPPDLDARLVQGHRPAPFLAPYPAGSMAGTVHDMGALLVALLGGGAPILSRDSVDLLLAQHWRGHGEAPGVAYGFFETLHNGLRALHHTGDGGHHSVVLLVPERNLGLYFVAATDDERAILLRLGLARVVLDALAPPPANGSTVDRMPTSPDLSAYLGLWVGVDRVESSIEKIASLPFQGRVSTDPDGALRITSFGGEISERLRPIATDLFRGTDDGFYAFRRDAAGHPAALIISGELSDPLTLRRAGWLEDARLHLGIVVFFGLVVASTVVVGILRRLRRSGARPGPARGRTAERTLALATAIVVLCPIVVFAGFLVDHPPYDRLPAQVLVCIVLLHALVLVVGVQAYFAVRSWLEGWWGLTYRTYYSVASVAGLAFAAFLLYWNVLGFRF